MKARLRAWVLAPAALALASGEAAAQTLSLIRDGEIESILRSYSDPLFEAAGLEPEEVGLHIVQEDQLNAFVADGKNMFLFTGLLTTVETPGELKGVIAHEIGHIAGGHSVTRSAAIRGSTGISLISIGLGILAMALGAPDAGLGLILGGQSVAQRTLFSYTRGQESSADQAGLSYLERIGESGEGMISFMDKIRGQEVLSARRQNPYYRTHPTGSARIRAMRQRVARMQPVEPVSDDEARAQLAMMQAKLVGFLGPEEKVRRRYPDSDISKPARYARGIAAFQANDLASAHAEIDALLEAEPRNPWFHELKGQILFENAKARESIAPNERAVEYGPPSALLLINLARSLLSVGETANIGRAQRLLRKALLLEPDNAFAWGFLAKAHGALGQRGKAELATAEQAFALGDWDRAYGFARRAEARLPLGGASRRRAVDILEVARGQSSRGFGERSRVAGAEMAGGRQ